MEELLKKFCCAGNNDFNPLVIMAIDSTQSKGTFPFIGMDCNNNQLYFLFPGHLPAAHVFAGHLTVSIISYVLVGNTLAGIMFGYLYKRFGLESAMMAHGLAHLIADIGILTIHVT